MRDEWKPEHFEVKRYDIRPESPGEGTDFDEGHVTMVILVNGRETIRQHLRTPGLVALVSRPDSDGVEIHQIVPGGSLADTAGGEPRLPMTDWQRTALGV